MEKKTNENDQTIWQAVKDGWKNVDAHSFPGFVMFLLLIATEAAANIIASLPDFGWIVGGLVGLFFGVFMAGWHIITERVKNSNRQQSTSEGIVMATGIISILLLFVNLIRLSGDGSVDWQAAISSLYPTADGVSGWDYVAITLVGVVFAIHLFGYLDWHKHDDIRKSSRSHAGKMNVIAEQERSAERSLRVAEVKLLAIDAEINKTDELRKKYAHLPASILNPIIEEARKEVRQAFEKKYDVDLDGDGHKGAPPQTRPQTAPAPVYAADVKDYTPTVESKPKNPPTGQGQQ